MSDAEGGEGDPSRNPPRRLNKQKKQTKTKKTKTKKTKIKSGATPFLFLIYSQKRYKIELFFCNFIEGKK